METNDSQLDITKLHVAEKTTKSESQREVTIIAPEAWQWYNTELQGTSILPRQAFVLAEAMKVAEALKRPITLQEIQLLIRHDPADRGEYRCSHENCGAKVVPVIWAMVDNKLLHRVQLRKSVCWDMVKYRGSFFYAPRSGKRITFCGAPYFFHKQANGKSDTCEPNRHTHFGKYVLAHGAGSPFEKLEKVLLEDAKAKELLASVCRNAGVSHPRPRGKFFRR